MSIPIYSKFRQVQCLSFKPIFTFCFSFLFLGCQKRAGLWYLIVESRTLTHLEKKNRRNCQPREIELLFLFLIRFIFRLCFGYSHICLLQNSKKLSLSIQQFDVNAIFKWIHQQQIQINNVKIDAIILVLFVFFFISFRYCFTIHSLLKWVLSGLATNKLQYYLPISHWGFFFLLLLIAVWFYSFVNKINKKKNSFHLRCL